MKLSKLALLLLLFFSTAASLSATSYYVSPYGNDYTFGTSSLFPWASIAKVNSANLRSGDQVYFQRGGTWRDIIVPQAGNITYGAYGTGNMPTISGADLLSDGWICSNGSTVWTYTLAIAPTQVWFQGILGIQVASAAAVQAPLQWAYVASKLYVFSTSYPRSPNPIIEASQRATALYIPSSISGITVQDLAFTNTGLVGICMCGGTGLATFTDDVFSGALNEGFAAYSGQVVINQSEIINNGIGVSFHSGTSLTINDSILSGNANQAVLVTTSTSGNQITKSTISGNASHNAGVGTVVNLSTSALKVDTSILLPNPFMPKVFNYSGITDDGTNVFRTPSFKTRAAPLIVVPYIDDYINLAVAQAVSQAALANGCTMSYALNTKLVTPADWNKIALMQKAGVEVVAHTRSHSDLANNNVFSIQYTGKATSAIMTINQTTGRLQTFLNGSTTPDLNLDLTNTYNGIVDVLGLIPTGSSYTVAIQLNQNFFTPINLAAAANIDIYTAPYMTQARPEYLTWEVEGAQSDIAANLPGTVLKAFATPYTSSDQTVENHIRDAGFAVNRNGTLTAASLPNGNWLFSSLDVYNMASEWLPNAYDATKPASSAGALVEGLGAAGGVMAVYSHGYNEFTLQNWNDLFSNLKSLNATCMTMSQANAYVQKNGTLLPDGTKKNWVQIVALNPDFTVTSTSPIAQGARDLGGNPNLALPSLPLSNSINPFSWFF